MRSQRLQYLYAFIPTKEYNHESSPILKGIEEESVIEFKEFGDITAVICQVDQEGFSEENLAKNIEDMTWLQEKAFHHHQVINQLHTSYTIIPLKFGTIYETVNNLKATVSEYEEEILNLLSKLEGNEEWNVKIYVKDDKFRESVLTTNEEIKKKEEEISELPKGKQFFEKKKMSQFIEDQIDKTIKSSCKEIHERLKGFALEDKLKKNWNKKVTGKAEDMHWNSAYLLPKKDSDAFIAAIKEEQKQAYETETGIKFEVTGPWPAFHFSNFLDRGVKNGT